MRPAVSIRDRQCHRCDPRCQFGIGEWIDAFREVNFESGEWIDAFRELNLGPANGSMRSAKSIWVRRMDAIAARLSSRASTVPHRLMQNVRPIQNDLAISEEYAPASHRLRLRWRFDECRTVVGLAMPPEAFKNTEVISVRCFKRCVVRCFVCGDQLRNCLGARQSIA